MKYYGKTLKMYFPADTTLSDYNTPYQNFDGKNISNKEISREKLWSKD